MTVQPSVTLWTVLCFLALMLILDRLLFRPLLAFMDKRQEKIDRARREKAEALEERERELARREEDRTAAKRQALERASAALEETREEYDRRAAERRAENERKLEALQSREGAADD